MARPRGRPKGKPEPEPEPEPEQAGRVTIINLKGSQEQADWLGTVNRATHIPKSAIIRLAIAEWAVRHGHPPFPGMEGDK